MSHKEIRRLIARLTELAPSVTLVSLTRNKTLMLCRAVTIIGACALVWTAAALAQNDEDQRGPIVFATSRNMAGGNLQLLLDRWNATHPKEKVKTFVLPISADEQRVAVTHLLQTHDQNVDVINADVVWISEFAAREWLEPLEESRFANAEILAGPADTARYGGHLYGAPYTTDVGMLFYRTDLVAHPPTNWSELRYLCETVATIAAIPCYAGQFAEYEGLTVNVFELIGPRRTDDLAATFQSSQAKAAIGFLVDGFHYGWIPKEAILFREEDGRHQFEAGELLFLRDWSYVYSRANNRADPETKVAGKFDIAPIPGPRGPTPSILGGSDLILSRYSRHKATAKDWMAFMQSEDTQRAVLTVLSQMPVRAAIYTDPALEQRMPYLPTIKRLIGNAITRPKVRYYNSLTVSIGREVTAALDGEKGVDEALANLTAEVKQAAAAHP
jgi:multiple sugar transport system substrate-binding protein